jgi:hypothetical protein
LVDRFLEESAVSRSPSALCLCWALLLATLPFGTAAGAETVDYKRDIRPLLSDTCFNCHGPDEKQRKARLRLDTREGLLRAIVPGKPGESELVLRIHSDDPMVLMLPPTSGKVLKPQQKEILRRWIEQGASWSRHWAFLPPRRPTTPPIQNPKSEIRNPIDRFILARLERDKGVPSPVADRVTLLWRLSLDLVGTPPSCICWG